MKDVSSSDIALLGYHDGVQVKAVDMVNDRVFTRKIYYVGAPKIPVIVYNRQTLWLSAMGIVKRR
jgi:hypothetical protein